MNDHLANAPARLIYMGNENGEMVEDTITIDEVRVLSQSTMDALFEAWEQLRNIVAQYEMTLNKWWLKKTMNHRREILLKAWPEMPPMHRPDFEVLRNEQRSKRKVKVAAEIALRFPHLNLEDLSKPKPLLLMIDSRSRNHPSVFTNADRNSIGAGIRSKMLVPRYMRGYAMYLNGEYTRQTYGRLVSWEQDRESIFKCHTGIAPDPGMGLMILEIQRETLQFLVRCSAAILRTSAADLCKPESPDMPLEPSIPRNPPRPDVKSPWNNLTTEHESLATHAAEAPYRAPDAYDFKRLRSLVRAKCLEVEDHFLLIREDPGYFAELVQEACGHTTEAILNRQYSPSSTRLSEESWSEALSRVLMTAYHDVFLWESVSRLFDRLVEIYTEQKAEIQLGQIWPDTYLEAFSRLGFVLLSINIGYLNILTDYMSAVPSFKNLIINTPKPNGRYETYVRKQPDDYLWWLFRELVKEAENLKKTCGLPDILHELETMVTTDQQQKKRLTWRLVRLISDVAVIAEMQRHLSLSSCHDYSLTSMSQKENQAWIEIHMAPLAKIRDVLKEGTGLAALVMDLRVFDYPSGKPRTAVTTAKMRSAEQALDLFWEKLDEHFVRKTGKTLKEHEANKIQYRDIQRTPAWTDPRASVSEREKDGKDTEILDVLLALATLQERTESTIGPSEPSKVRQKVKTRGSLVDNAQAEDPEPTPVTNQDSTAVEAPRLSVKKKAFNTFAALFGKPMADKLPGELPWTDFKKAMVNVGFGAEKLQGSGWLFESERRSIIFHEPHPESKLPMHWARRIARRLNRNFGWTADTFVLEDGTENGNANLAAS
ncbi:MAG: hypothetical protein Q9172_002344 [Xanthocarpia lactea]